MRYYKTNNGNYINLALCHRVYIKKSPDGFAVVAAVDQGEDDEVNYFISKYFTDKQEAQEHLDSIMKKIRGD